MSWLDEIPQAARDYLETNRLDEVECVIADFPGIARGKAADLLLLDRDPLTDIAATRSIRAVVLRGRLYDRAALDRMLADVRARVAAFPQPKES